MFFLLLSNRILESLYSIRLFLTQYTCTEYQLGIFAISLCPSNSMSNSLSESESPELRENKSSLISVIYHITMAIETENWKTEKPKIERKSKEKQVPIRLSRVAWGALAMRSFSVDRRSSSSRSGSNNNINNKRSTKQQQQ